MSYWFLRRIFVFIVLTWLLAFMLLRLVIGRSRVLFAYVRSRPGRNVALTTRE